MNEQAPQRKYEKSAWNTLIWFGALVMMAEQLNKTGVIDAVRKARGEAR